MMYTCSICILLAVSLNTLSAQAQEASEDDGQERTLGLFRHRNRYNYLSPVGGGGGLFGGSLLSSVFGGGSYNPYFRPGFGYPGSYSPYFGGPAGPPGGFFGPGLGPGYAPGFGGYRQFPGGYSGRSKRNSRPSRDIGPN